MVHHYNLGWLVAQLDYRLHFNLERTAIAIAIEMHYKFGCRMETIDVLPGLVRETG